MKKKLREVDTSTSVSSSNEYHTRYYDILIKILKCMPAYSHLRNEKHEKVKYKRGKGIE